MSRYIKVWDYCEGWFKLSVEGPFVGISHNLGAQAFRDFQVDDFPAHRGNTTQDINTLFRGVLSGSANGVIPWFLYEEDVSVYIAV